MLLELVLGAESACLLATHFHVVPMTNHFLRTGALTQAMVSLVSCNMWRSTVNSDLLNRGVSVDGHEFSCRRKRQCGIAQGVPCIHTAAW